MMLRAIDTSKARIYFANGEVEHFRSQVFAGLVWLMVPRESKVAYRAPGDTRPVQPWDRPGARIPQERRLHD